MKTNTYTPFCSATRDTWKEASGFPSKRVVLAVFTAFMVVVGGVSEHISPASPRNVFRLNASAPTVHVTATAHTTSITNQAFQFVLQRIIQKTRTLS